MGFGEHHAGATAPPPLEAGMHINAGDTAWMLTSTALTQSLRALLAGRGVRVHAVLTGPTDTDMTQGFDIPKASPESVARAIFDGVDNGEDDIFPDPASQSLAESWRSAAVKALERENAAFIAAGPAAA
jgi:short-subunit dehydrogenase